MYKIKDNLKDCIVNEFKTACNSTSLSQELCIFKSDHSIVRSASLSTYPGESEAADGISEHVAEQRRKRVESWEVGVHVRTLPVSHLCQPRIIITNSIILLSNSSSRLLYSNSNIVSLLVSEQYCKTVKCQFGGQVS